MLNIIPIKEGSNLPGLIMGGTGLAKPFAQDVYLTSFFVAGTQYTEDIEDHMARLEKDTQVKLVREPKNPYDSYAILVKDMEGNKLGYMPRNMNHMPARLMDAGKFLYGKVISCSSEWDRVSIRIGMYMKD